jgi:hypothetical protein
LPIEQRQGGTVAAPTPQRVDNSHCGLPPNFRAFGDSLCHRSEPDWHFQEKPIHLRRLDDRSPAWHGSLATAGKLYKD